MRIIKTVMSPNTNSGAQFLEYQNKKFRLNYYGNPFQKSFEKGEFSEVVTYSYAFSPESVSGSVLKDDEWYELIQDGDVYYPNDTEVKAATESEALETRSKSVFEAMQEHVEMLYTDKTDSTSSL